MRNFEVLGEAARHISSEVQKKHKRIPWTKIRGMRHLLAHEYFGVNSEIIWTTITKHLPDLLKQLKEILKEDAPPGG